MSTTTENPLQTIASLENITVPVIKLIEEVKLPNVDELVLDVKQVVTAENDADDASVPIEDPLLDTTKTKKQLTKEDEADKVKKKKGRRSSFIKDSKVSPRSYLHLDEESLKVIRSKGAQHQRLRRAKETPEQKADRMLRQRISLMKHRLLERLSLSEDQLNNKKEELKTKIRNWRTNRFNSMTPEQHKEFWRKKNKKKKYYAERASVLETPEEFAQRRDKERLNSAKNFKQFKANATPEQIQALRARQRKYREARRDRHQAMKEIDKLLKAHLKGK